VTNLPSWATEMLKQAASVQNTEKDPNARVKSVDRVTQHLRAVIPEHFQEDPHGSEDRDE
jgi:hypothetical protein